MDINKARGQIDVLLAYIDTMPYYNPFKDKLKNNLFRSLDNAYKALSE